MNSPRVTVGIPVYRGSDFVAEALASLQAQSFRDFHALVSIDGGDQESAEVCRRFTGDSRVEVVVQNRRLGFAGNLNLLADAGRASEFFVYLGQDDLLHPDCLARLVQVADGWPQAAVIYSDLQCFGTADRVESEPELTGAPLERVAGQLRQFQWLALRGLRRNAALQAVAPLVRDSPDNLFEDVIWFADVMRVGTAKRVPQCLYRKRYHPRSWTTTQAVWPPDRVRRGWLHAWMHLARIALATAASPAEARQVWRVIVRAAAVRSERQRWFFDPGAIALHERADLVDALVDYLAPRLPDLPRQLDRAWPGVRCAAWRVVARGLAPASRLAWAVERHRRAWSRRWPVVALRGPMVK